VGTFGKAPSKSQFNRDDPDQECARRLELRGAVHAVTKEHGSPRNSGKRPLACDRKRLPQNRNIAESLTNIRSRISTPGRGERQGRLERISSAQVDRARRNGVGGNLEDQSWKTNRPTTLKNRRKQRRDFPSRSPDCGRRGREHTRDLTICQPIAA